MRWLLFSDLHLREESKEICWKVLERVLLEAQKHSADGIGFCGDFWHHRYTIPAELLDVATQYIVSMAERFGLVMVPGNHDQYDTAGNNALSVWNEIDGCVVPTEAMRIDDDPQVLWLPWAEPDVQSTWLDRFDCPIVFGHAQISGALMNNLRAAPEGWDISAFDHGRALTILGHFHKPQSWLDGRLQYIGSPYQTRADETMQQKRFLLVDTAADLVQPTVREIPLDIGPRYWNVNAENASLLLPQVRPGDVVRSIAKTADEAQAVEAAAAQQAIEVRVAKLEPGSAPRYALPAGTGADEYARAWVEQNATLADRDRLLAMWEELR